MGEGVPKCNPTATVQNSALDRCLPKPQSPLWYCAGEANLLYHSVMTKVCLDQLYTRAYVENQCPCIHTRDPMQSPQHLPLLSIHSNISNTAEPSALSSVSTSCPHTTGERALWQPDATACQSSCHSHQQVDSNPQTPSQGPISSVTAKMNTAFFLCYPAKHSLRQWQGGCPLAA